MRNTVQRGYVQIAEQYHRTLIDSLGRVYLNRRWVPAVADVVRVGTRYERWSDVPEAWIGHLPYWSVR